MPLDARVVSLSELLQRYPVLDVPNYQRTFKWTPDFIEKFFDDILAGLDFASDGDGRGHFLGSIVVCKRDNDGGWDLVDGQQRLTALTIMLWKLACLSSKATYASGRLLIMSPGSETLTRLQHKKGNRDICSDRDAYFEVAARNEAEFTKYPGDDATSINKNHAWSEALSSSPIYKASATLGKVAKRAAAIVREARKCKNEAAAADHLFAKLSQGIKLISIETDQRKEGMRVFASLNAGGTKLEPWELIMSAFYTHGPKPEQQERTELVFEHDKHSIAKQLRKGDDDAGINNGLRTYWLATHRITRMDDLFNEFNEALAGAKDAAATHDFLLKEILLSVPVLKGFESASSTVEMPGKGRHSIDMSSVYPLTIAMKDRLSRCILLAAVHHLRRRDAMQHASEVMRRVSFALERARMQLIACKLRSNFVDKPYSDIAVAINSGKAGDSPDSIEDFVYKQLRLIDGLGDKEAFEFALKKINPLQNKDMANVFASRMQFALRNPSRPGNWYTNVPIEDDPDFGGVPALNITLKGMDDGDAQRIGFSSITRLAELTRSLGNLMATTTPEDGQPNMELELNRGVELSELDEKALASRRDEMAELACRVWSF